MASLYSQVSEVADEVERQRDKLKTIRSKCRDLRELYRVVAVAINDLDMTATNLHDATIP